MAKIASKLLWYLKRPEYYPELFRMVILLTRNFLRISKNTKKEALLSKGWCEKRAVSTEQAIKKITGKNIISFEHKFNKELSKAKERQEKCPVTMGGPANLDILYSICEHIKAEKVIETGVAYGWSSLATLLSIKDRKYPVLVSTDKPYPGEDNEKYVGCVVPEELKKYWRIFRGPDKNVLPKAINKIKKADLCHYDSDKLYEGRTWAYPLLWEILRKDGFFISDDIADNMAFHDFCKRIKKEPIIIRTDSNYIGILFKNGKSINS